MDLSRLTVVKKTAGRVDGGHEGDGRCHADHGVDMMATYGRRRGSIGEPSTRTTGGRGPSRGPSNQAVLLFLSPSNASPT